ncbi:MAG: carbohydrate ABC transporter permease, partial [Victivallaceae bacterium]
AGSSKSGVDAAENSIIPGFILSNDALYAKSIEAFFNEDSISYQTTYSIHNGDFKKAETPVGSNNLIGDWESFIKEKDYPFYYYGLAFIASKISRNSQPENFRKFKKILYDRFDGNIETMNLNMETEYVNWSSFRKNSDLFLSRRNMPDFETEINPEYWKFKVKQPVNQRYYFSPEGFYKTIFLRARYTKNIEEYNRTNNTNYLSWNEITFPRYCRNNLTAGERRNWEEFVRDILNLLWVRVDQRALPRYQSFLKAKYPDISELNRLYGTKYKTHKEIKLAAQTPFFGSELSDTAAFIQGWSDPVSGETYKVPVEMLYINSIEFDFRDHLRNVYKTIDNFNDNFKTDYKDWLHILPPQKAFHYKYIQEHKTALRWEFCKRNFITVVNFIALQGRGIMNTLIYCGMAVFCALIVNPMAAYALSRYRPPARYKILLVLMLTMAFPPIVTQIPNFLLLREFGLLNSYAALILPGLANGYSIFLLKGFFDSLPAELYESAMIDGASETRIFFQITMSLSKPILAVIALQAFQLAYSNFLMALLLCQDEKMWTIMPWLYQLQMRSGQGVIFASLLIAAIPTFLVFALCQNVIMRGIVVPVEK